MHIKKLINVTLVTLVLTACTDKDKLVLTGERIPINPAPTVLLSKTVLAPISKAHNYDADFSLCSQCQLNGSYINNYSGIESLAMKAVNWEQVKQTFTLPAGEKWGYIANPLVYKKNNAWFIEQATNKGLNRIKYNIEENTYEQWQQSDLVLENEGQGGIAARSDISVFTTGLNQILAISPDNNLLWQVSLPTPTRGNPILIDNLAIVQSLENKTYAISLKDGKIVWQHFGDGEAISAMYASTPIIYKDQIFIQYTNNELISLNPQTGSENWRMSLENIFDGGIFSYNNAARLTISDDALYTNTSTGNLIKINLQTQDVEWVQPINIQQDLWVTSEALIALTANNQITAIDKKNGEMIWQKSLVTDEKSPLGSFTSPTVVNNEIWVVSSAGLLTVYNYQNGELIRQHKIPDDIYNRPIVTSIGVFLIDKHGTVYLY